MDTQDLPRSLGPIALATGATLFVAMHASFLISASLGIVEWCVPYLDGCTSISRAARSFPVVYFFRGLMMPTALGILACALLLRVWLLALGAPRRPAVDLIAVLGVFAVVGLLIYCTFLGTGDTFRPYRRFSVITFLSCFVIIQLLVANEVLKLVRGGVDHDALRPTLWAMAILCALQVGLGFANFTVVPFLESNDNIENSIEWFVVMLMVVYCVVIYRGWRATGFMARVCVQRLDRGAVPTG